MLRKLLKRCHDIQLQEKIVWSESRSLTITSRCKVERITFSLVRATNSLSLSLSLSMEIATVWCWIARLPWATRTRRRERSENYLRPFRLGIYCQSGSYVMASCVVSCARPMIRRGSPRNTCVAKRHGKWEYFILPATTWWNEPPRLEACRKKHSGDSTVSFYWQVFLNLWGIKSPCGYF